MQPHQYISPRPRTPPRGHINNHGTSPDAPIYQTGYSPVRIRQPSFQVQPAQAAAVEHGCSISRPPSAITRKPVGSAPGSRHNSMKTSYQYPPSTQPDWPPFPAPSAYADHPSPYADHIRRDSASIVDTQPPTMKTPDIHNTSEYFDIDVGKINGDRVDDFPHVEQLQYHHSFEPPRKKLLPQQSHDRIYFAKSTSPTRHIPSATGSPNHAHHRGSPSPTRVLSRPMSALTLGSDFQRGRSASPHYNVRSETSSPMGRGMRGVSSGRSPSVGLNVSTLDLLNIPYAQQVAHQSNAQLRAAVGANASLLDTRKTLEMYRANVKKTTDPAIQYEFAIFMISAAQSTAPSPDAHSRDDSPVRTVDDREELLLEAKQILQKLADRSYVYAQYYLADGYFSGLFNKGKEDQDRAFPLFVSAGKHGHAEASYRAALCYEFGWGCRKDYAKAVQFYRQAASKNHPGASTRLGMACLRGDMGLGGKYREGIKWLKRATESADHQHNQAPFELGLLHMNGYGDDVFKDEGYAAQLFTKAAELGHAEASLRMGEAYEHGLLTCPKDPALSIHFYTGAAQAGVPKAMMALCAWYIVGAEPVLEKDEAEAYEWARRSAECGYTKAEYAVAYFTEMGIGCRRDHLEANVWYVRAAEHGEEHAKQRLAIIRAAETGDMPMTNGKAVKKKKSMIGGDGDCIVM